MCRKNNLVEEQLFLEMFSTQCNKNPNRVAVECDSNSISYIELESKSNDLALILKNKGIDVGDTIGIMMNYRIEMVISILGVLKSGANYLPIDPMIPLDRMQYILDDSDASIVLVDTENNRETGYDFLDVCHLLKDRECHIDSPLTKISEDKTFYTIYTSGSTGKPKGVMINESSFVNLLKWYTKILNIGSEDIVLQVAPVYFDLAQKNIFVSLLVGAKIVLYSRKFYHPRSVLRLLSEKKVTLLNCTPSMFSLLVKKEEDFDKLIHLKNLVLGGEKINVRNIREWMLSGKMNSKVFNTYGPTECTDIATFYELKIDDIKQSKNIPIGKPIPNVNLFLDKASQFSSDDNDAGELLIGGICVGAGYIGNNNESRCKYAIEKRFSSDTIYRTGDFVRQLDDGNYEFICRCDSQVKFNGYRIELDEIENALLKIDNVNKACVLFIEGENNDSKIIAYYQSELPIEANRIVQELKKYIPKYMIPLSFVHLKNFHLNRNGKIDKKKMESLMELNS